MSLEINAARELIIKLGPRQDALEPGIHCARTHWNRGFMRFQLVRHTRSVVLMVRAGLGSGVPGAGPGWPAHPAQTTNWRLSTGLDDRVFETELQFVSTF